MSGLARLLDDKRLANVFGFEVRIVSEDFVVGGAVCDLADDDGDGYPHASYACAAAHDVRLESDTIKHWGLPAVWPLNSSVCEPG